MTKIVFLRFKTLPNAAHFFFFSIWKSEIENAGANVKNALMPLMPGFTELYDLEKQHMEWVIKSEYTRQIADADRLVDADMNGLKAQVKVSLHAFDPAVAKAAERLMIMLQSYGNVTKQPYLQEQGDVQIIIDNLTGSYAADVAAVPGVREWVDDLQKNYTLFNTLYKERNKQSVQKPPQTFKEVRGKIETVYHEMEEIVNAGAVIGSKADFTALIDIINPEIERLNTEFHKGKHDISTGDSCVVEPISTQSYTGKAVTPIPKAHYRHQGKPTVELTFAKDFSVTYKNNLEVGTADLTLHGKGEYTGKKTVTFSIAR